ncbi:KxYKxGKxW signal peptide domain-containing protein [Leuconostoc gasicomitatum]|uniref:KxYKxGKxW signal peptide domain-containing protein n=1 Tax=Leuconostoc gasicomitatum TaxID=115778 RepID=UPI001CC711EF|nr:papain-like cysteine protease family protein [Leuconostoc gasicomitatum]MBR2277450.1 KxYKxGKxW signal peptide domain-containing protein [Leuconostoc sp.]MBZ5953555.1 KxYKxGKxW signal peptide domain-containing protein [Leuconostoc gasicomitatum]MBZ5954469.1 KxYKxGKxW signal peptide domain-containing protein [Leuconostoc gasicomitatum]
MIKGYKLYKVGKRLVTGVVLTTGIMAAFGINSASADTTPASGSDSAVVKSDTNQSENQTLTASSSVKEPDHIAMNSSKNSSDNIDNKVADSNITTTQNDKDKAQAEKQTTSNTDTTVNNDKETAKNSSLSSSTVLSTDSNDKATNVTPSSEISTVPTSGKTDSSAQVQTQEPVKNGWINKNGTNQFYENGKIVVGEKNIDNYWYNFDKQGNYSVGLTNLLSKTVYYDNNGHMHYGYLKVDQTYMYFDEKDGHAVTGERDYGNGKMQYYGQDFKQIQNNYVRTNANTIYFFGTNGDAVKGIRNYDNGKMEYYSNNYNQVRNNYVRTNANTIYFFGTNGDAIKGIRNYDNGKMEYYGNNYNQVRNNYVRTNANTIYFFGANGDAVKGLRYYGSHPYQVEYYGNNYNQLRNTSIRVNGKKYDFGGNGDLIIAKKPVYFSHLDSRWSNHRFNDYSMGQAGCVPTSIAMVLNGSYGINVNPDDVKTVMNNLSQSSFGATGRDLINTINAYGRKVEQINTVERTANLLQQGVPVIFFVNVAGGIGHAITTYGYSNGATEVLDPYNRCYYNGWYDVSAISNNLSRDSSDWNAGRPVFAIM